MGMTPTFGSGFVAAQVNAFQANLESAILFLLNYLGEELVKYAKEKHNYTDQTGNLTNSMSYVVVHNKQIVFNGATNQPGISGSAAIQTAMKMAAETQGNGFSLIIVAGMNYAAAVEAKGYNVLVPAELKAKTDFPAAMQRLQNIAKEKANNKFGIEI